MWTLFHAPQFAVPVHEHGAKTKHLRQRHFAVAGDYGENKGVVGKLEWQSKAFPAGASLERRTQVRDDGEILDVGYRPGRRRCAWAGGGTAREGRRADVRRREAFLWLGGEVGTQMEGRKWRYGRSKLGMASVIEYKIRRLPRQFPLGWAWSDFTGIGPKGFAI